MAGPRMRIAASVLGAPDPQALGAFYARLLGWTVVGWIVAMSRAMKADGGRRE